MRFGRFLWLDCNLGGLRLCGNDMSSLRGGLAALSPFCLSLTLKNPPNPAFGILGKDRHTNIVVLLCSVDILALALRTLLPPACPLLLCGPGVLSSFFDVIARLSYNSTY